MVHILTYLQELEKYKKITVCYSFRLYQALFKVANYYLECLTEIAHILPNAKLSVTFDDVDLIFDLNARWIFPTDEEYKE